MTVNALPTAPSTAPLPGRTARSVCWPFAALLVTANTPFLAALVFATVTHLPFTSVWTRTAVSLAGMTASPA